MSPFHAVVTIRSGTVILCSIVFLGDKVSPSSHSAHSGGKVRVFLQNHQTVNPVMFIEAVFTRAMMALLVVVDCWRICALAIGFYFFPPPKKQDAETSDNRGGACASIGRAHTLQLSQSMWKSSCVKNNKTWNLFDF